MKKSAYRNMIVILLSLMQYPLGFVFLTKKSQGIRKRIFKLTTEPPQNDIPLGDQNKTNARRIRYKGTHPRIFKLKYKELRGDNVTLAKLKEKGITPASQHVPIMTAEVLHHLALTQERRSSLNSLSIVDCTLGYGGHTIAMITSAMKLEIPAAKFIGLDQDLTELRKTTDRVNQLLNSSRRPENDQGVSFVPYHTNFRNILQIAEYTNVTGIVDCLLADLGFSSMQVDNPDRGFTYKVDGPLDMRMDVTASNETARSLIRRLSRKDLAAVIEENSDEALAFIIASALKKSLPNTTLELAQTVKTVCIEHAKLNKLPVPNKKDSESVLARVMQAIRIEVNQEFAALDDLLAALPRILRPGGRVVILTFHSGEDRRVKKSFKKLFNEGVYSEWGRNVVRPSREEIFKNPRSKCCKLRWAISAL